MKQNDLITDFSLLYPQNSIGQPAIEKWGENTLADLGIDKIVMALSVDKKYRDGIKKVLLELSRDSNTLTYRQQILEDFVSSAEIVHGFEEILPLLAKLHDSAMVSSQGMEVSLPQTLGRLTELNSYVTCVRKLHDLLMQAGPGPKSQGLCKLRDLLAKIEKEETFQSLEKNLPEILSRLNSIPSITIGVNLDNELRPFEATLLSINEKPFTNGTLLEKLMGKKASGKFNHGISPLHSVPFLYTDSIDSRVVRSPLRADPMMVPLFHDLYKVLRNTLTPIAISLRQYAQVNVNFLIALEAEIAFYLGGAALIRRMLTCGLPMCRPEILPEAERICDIQEMYNLLLALRLAERELEPNLANALVPNDANFGPEGRIFILTGPNQGGKTVYTQAIGVAQLLFQAGLYVPAGQAQISPVDMIYTHFATEEKGNPGMGRLGEEARRLNEIFRSATSHGLVLLNESLSSTSPGESLYLARDIVCALRLFGTRAIFATHLHELAEGVEKINSEIPGDSRVVSLVAAVAEEGEKGEISEDTVARTYKIKVGPPKGLSYSKGIAIQYGISYEQLATHWQERSNLQKKGITEP